jgi:hypothetical protein
MKNNVAENQYLLLFRDDGWYTHLSVEELEAVMGKFRTWFENLSAKGIVRGGQALGREGRNRSMAAIVVIGSWKILAHWLKTRLELTSRLRRS